MGLRFSLILAYADHRLLQPADASDHLADETAEQATIGLFRRHPYPEKLIRVASERVHGAGGQCQDRHFKIVEELQGIGLRHRGDDEIAGGQVHGFIAL